MRAGLLTLGHSNRSLEEFIALLLRESVGTLVDVRSLRGSRALPHFNEETLAGALGAAGIAYAPIESLGGRRRKASSPTPPSCWRNRSFHNYADHMRTKEFHAGVAELLALARAGPLALMCAEAVPWRCHRSLIADHLVVDRKRRVDELVGDARRPHQLTVCARVVAGRLTYDAADAAEDTP